MVRGPRQLYLPSISYSLFLSEFGFKCTVVNQALSPFKLLNVSLLQYIYYAVPTLEQILLPLKHSDRISKYFCKGKKEEINLINLHDLDPDPDPDQFISSADSLSASKLNGS